MTAPFDLNAVKARFHDLGRQREAKIEAVRPVREAYEALRAKQHAIDNEIAPLREKIKQMNAEIAPIEEERAVLVRILNYKTGAP